MKCVECSEEGKNDVHENITIVIADDHPIFLRGLRQIIEARENLEIIGEAGDGSSALTLIEDKEPDIAILDVNMPGMDGLVVAARIQKKNLPVRVIVLTMYGQEDIFRQALDFGVMGYVLKASAATDIVGCIQSVASGKRFVSPELSDYLIRTAEQFGEGMDRKLRLSELSPTQRKILHLIAGNKTTAEIADELCISPKTVENHRSHICEKLDLHGPNALLRFVLEHKDHL